MNIATQGGKIILKDGKLAEGCGCCGGWYCCPQVALCPERLRIRAEVTASDATGIFTLTDARCSGAPLSMTAVKILNASALSGAHDLTRTQTTPSSSVFEKSFASDGVGCSGALVSVTVYGTNACEIVLSCNEYHWQSQVSSATPPTPLTLGAMKCSTHGSAVANCDPQSLYYRTVRRFTNLNIPINLDCLSLSYTVAASVSTGVRAPFYESLSGDGDDGVRGGTFRQSYSGSSSVAVTLTFSTD